jgi:RNase adaptor protein for sRNA GlmZ degradation
MNNEEKFNNAIKELESDSKLIKDIADILVNGDELSTDELKEAISEINKRNNEYLPIDLLIETWENKGRITYYKINKDYTLLGGEIYVRKFIKSFLN